VTLNWTVCTSELGDQRNLLFQQITGLLFASHWPVKSTDNLEDKKKMNDILFHKNESTIRD
jgi:hypothetical protein